MKFVADFHIHSHYSRATSPELTFENLHKWAQLKGVQVVGSGDLSHPGWLQEMREKLEPAEDGLFRLKAEYARAMQPQIFAACRQPVRFILSGEISNIYKKHEKTRKNHNVVFLPSFDAVEKFQNALEKVGNIRSDGRPILGLDARDLLEIVLETDPQAHLIPAHIWTPWFSLFGSKSGFETIEECFEDLTPHIFALETGLSTDPPMNWRWSALDGYTLVSNSDAHSPQKLAREANLFDTELTYASIFKALHPGTPEKFLGTIEFFPEEGKYHYDGHRKCGIVWNPETTREHGGICPVCGKSVTLGVMHRIAELADRREAEKPAQAASFTSLIPLPEILSEAYGVGATSKRVKRGYEYLLERLGAELTILRDMPLEDVQHVGGGLLAEGIRRMRSGEVVADAGYDGEYGVIKLFDERERKTLTTQLGFFPALTPQGKVRREKPLKTDAPSASPKKTRKKAADLMPALDAESKAASQTALLSELNAQQQDAVRCTERSLIIVAGPGTGKTRTITHRMAYLISEKGVSPKHLLAITFTNKAAEEMAQRLSALLGKTIAAQMTIGTFHAWCANVLRESGATLGLAPNFALCSDADRRTVLKQIFPELKEQEIRQTLDQISTAKNSLCAPDDPQWQQVDAETRTRYRCYQEALHTYQALDFDDLIFLTVKLFEAAPEILAAYQERFRWISVDEYQDLNFAQYRLIHLLKGADVNLCVIGDPNQAIYGFRGADRKYFLRFQEDFPNAESLHLTQNYRSTQAIVEASRRVIADGVQSAATDIHSEIVGTATLDLYHAPTYKAEAEYVVHEIERLVGGTTLFSMDSGRVASHEEGVYAFGDFAVLYRIGIQNQPLIEAFQRSGIPYQIVGQRSLYETREIQTILACLWAAYQPEATFHRRRLEQLAGEMPLFLHDLRQSLDRQAPLPQIIKRLQTTLFPENNDEILTERFKRLLDKAAQFGTRVRDFLQSTALHRDSDDYDPRSDRVTLMSLHASKGLEFPVVFLVGCEETLIPYQRQGQMTDVDEERRLFYVGITRAQEKLIFTHAEKRLVFGQTLHNPPSRFLHDLEGMLNAIQRRAHQRHIVKEKSQLRLFSSVV